MEETADKPSVRLQPEVVNESEVPATAAPGPEPKSEDVWTKFPPQVNVDSKSKPGKGLLIVVMLLVAITVALLGLVAKRLLMGGTTGSKTIVASDDAKVTPTVAPTAAPSPTPEITSKNKVKIQVLNGSGVTGQAGKVATALEKADFNTPTTGNAETDGEGTVVAYSPKVDVKLATAVQEALKDMFKSITLKSDATLTDYDIVVTTGTDPEE